jgi:hypothetical protein
MTSAALLLASCLALAGHDLDDVFAINQRSFHIPINIESSRRQEIRELLLFVSSDQGRTWSQTAVATPDREAFTFVAPVDGVYWFSLVIVDREGRREPPDIYQVPPGQKIVVDTVKPTVRITQAERQGDEVVVGWEIQDERPDLTTLRLEYRTADMPPLQWHPAVASPLAIGQARFRAGGQPISIRLSVQDTAKNAAVANAEIPASSTHLVSSHGNAPTSLVPGGTGTYAPPSHLADPGYQPAPPPHAPTSPPTGAYHPQVPSHAGTFGPAPHAGGSPPGQALPHDPLSGHRLVASSDYPIAPPPTPAPSAPARPRGPLPPVQLVNRTQLALDYEVARVGPSGIGRVELWMTQDDGRTWRLFADDPDLLPPLNVELPGEGVYGFSLVVQSRAGLGKKPPQPGDPPDLRVEVDLTPPAAKLFAPEPDPKQRDTLIISWSATDRNLPPNPVTLQWAERLGGSWETIGQDLPNNGRHSWKLPPNLPYRVYLRLLVRDAAHNSCAAETPEPVLVDLHEPEAKLIGISSLHPRN